MTAVPASHAECRSGIHDRRRDLVSQECADSSPADFCPDTNSNRFRTTRPCAPAARPRPRQNAASSTSFTPARPGPSSTIAFISITSILRTLDHSRAVPIDLVPRRYPFQRQIVSAARHRGTGPMPDTALQIDPRDNVLVALVPLAAGTDRAYRAKFLSRHREHSCEAQTRSRRLEARRPRHHVRHGCGRSDTAYRSRRPALHAQRPSSHRRLHRSTPSRHLRAARCLILVRPHLHGLSPRRRPGRHAQLLARPPARLLRKPQRRSHARGSRRRARLRQFAQQLSPPCPATCLKAGRERQRHRSRIAIECRPHLPQHRRRPLPHPPGRLRRHAPGRAGALRLARRLHPSSQRRRRHCAQPRLPECTVEHADGRAARSRSRN